jgi:hypothetical protein
MPSASKLLGDLVSSAGAISVTSGVANTAITGTITTAQIADNAITTAKVAASAIVTADIADANVTTAKIANSAITTALIANNSIITEDIVDRAITAAKIANTAVTAGVYGGSSNSALITIDAQGRVTAASNVTASGYSGPLGVQSFTAPGTFTVPPGITSVRVSITGGGGGGSGSSNAENGLPGAPGGYGGRGTKIITGLTAGANVAVTVGNAGNGGAVSGVSGNPGNSSTFGPYITATGGGGSPGIPAGGTPGAASGTTNAFDHHFTIGRSGLGGLGGITAGNNGAGFNIPFWPTVGQVGEPGIVIVEW